MSRAYSIRHQTTKKVLDYIVRQQETGKTPSLVDIGNHFGFSANTAKYHMNKLDQFGYVEIPFTTWGQIKLSEMEVKINQWNGETPNA